MINTAKVTLKLFKKYHHHKGLFSYYSITETINIAALNDTSQQAEECQAFCFTQATPILINDDDEALNPSTGIALLLATTMPREKTVLHQNAYS